MYPAPHRTNFGGVDARGVQATLRCRATRQTSTHSRSEVGVDATMFTRRATTLGTKHACVRQFMQHACPCVHSGCMRAFAMNFCTMWSRVARAGAWRVARSCVNRLRYSCSQGCEREDLEGALAQAFVIHYTHICQLFACSCDATRI